jgi:dolichyl-phosphate-mannose-protein mannosyltransferase
MSVPISSKYFAFIAAFVLIAISSITYQPSFRIGFYLDDYYNIERAGRIEWADAPRQIFDPRVQTLWYRPIQGLQFFAEYQLFGGNSNAYHLVNIAYHALNVLLIYGIAWRISRKWRIGFLTAFAYATFTVYNSGVNWVGIVEPLLGIFFLASSWFWWSYLEDGHRRDYWLAFIAFIFAMMAKQTALVIPVIFLLADRLLARQPVSISKIVRRYAPFVIAAALFSILEYNAPSTFTFTGWFGWNLGLNMISILWEYVVLIFFPWGNFPSIDLNPITVGNMLTYFWSMVVLVGLAMFAWHKRSRWVLFLAAFMLLTLGPVLPFPFLEHRYVYLPVIAFAVLLAFAIERAPILFSKPYVFTVAASACLAFLAFSNGWLVNNSVTAAAEWARTLRVPYRDIERQNPTFPKDTLLYFIDPITPTEGGLSGMFFLRYGKEITVRNWTEYAGLQDHNAAYIYYFDDQRRPQKVDVEKNSHTTISPALPVNFLSSIRLEGYELAQATIQRGTPLVLILYWRAMGPIDQDYTVFAHLVDRDGKIVAQSDSPPRKGTAPTTHWEPGRLSTDVVMFPIDGSAKEPNGYKLEIGLYDPAKGARVPIVDASGRPVTDVMTIDSLNVVE